MYSVYNKNTNDTTFFFRRKKAVEFAHTLTDYELDENATFIDWWLEVMSKINLRL